MKMNKVLSLLLCLALALSVILPVSSANAAESNNGMVINKTAKANDDGTYTITLEAYATGSKIITETKKDVPTDIVLVLDQSGSMSDPIGTVSYSAYSNRRNSNYYSNRHNGGNGNLWHLLTDGSYASVSVSVQESVTYDEFTSSTNDGYYDNRSNLYTLVNGNYVKVNVEVSYGRNSYRYTYTLEDGTEIGSATVGYYGGSDVAPTFTGYTLYLKTIDESASVYTYTYTDSDGNIQTIGTSTGANTQFGTTFYSRTVNTNAGGSRLAALQNAVRTFASAVAKKAIGDTTTTEDDINHRIAVVGFAHGTDSSDDFTGGYDYVNTELFVGSNQYTYGASADAQYTKAFQNMEDESGLTNLNASVEALSALGATQVDLGMTMASEILDANPVGNEERNQVVIVFTDGGPSTYSGFSKNVATTAITTADTLKGEGVTVYAVGVFAGASASSEGVEPSGNVSNPSSTELANYSNWFMQEISSNNGTPQTPSYYLSASDSDSLTNIFQQISDQIESGSTSSTLTSASVVKDIIAPEFTLPKNANITLETYACTGKSNGEYTWTKNADAMGATAKVNGDTVDVTGFDFSKNYVAEVTQNGVPTGSYQGHKLVITFTVQRKPEYLGGNSIETNTSAGIYEDANAAAPVVTFPQPVVNVPINQVVVANADDQNVYLYDTLTGADLMGDASVKVGDVVLKLNETNYGIEEWQNKDVKILVEITDKDGKAITEDTFANLTEDSEYNIKVTVSPKNTTPAAVGKPAVTMADDDDAKINVFKPVITFNDTAINLGETADYANNGGAINEWIHTVKNEDGSETTTNSKDVTMDTAVPTDIKYSYSIDAAAFTEEKEVKVTVSRGNSNVDLSKHVTFYRDACVFADCEHKVIAIVASEANRVNFVVHINSFDLTITKALAEGTALDEGQTFLFHITKGEDFSMDVVINGTGSVTISGLKSGDYTVTEDTAWSWRYTPDQNDVVANAENNEITFTNSRDNDKWLDGNAYAENIFADVQSTTN